MQQRYFSPIWLAFAILIGGLLLDILVSITLGISALPVNLIIGKFITFIVRAIEFHVMYLFMVMKPGRTGVIVVLGLGTVLRLALEFFQEWNSTRGSRRVESNVTIGYFPAI